MTDINDYIKFSKNVTLKEEGPEAKDWYSFKHQKVHIFNVAAKLLVETDMSPDEAITMAKEFVDTFYARIIKNR